MLNKRHGTVIALTADEYDRVMEAYGPSEIEVKAAPEKTTYETGAEELSLDGLVLTVSYANGTTEEIQYDGTSKNARQFSIGDVDLTTAGTKTVTVTYGEQSAEFVIEVTGEETGQQPDDTQNPDDSQGGQSQTVGEGQDNGQPQASGDTQDDSQSRTDRNIQAAAQTGDTTNLLLPFAGLGATVLLAAAGRRRVK